MKSENQTKKSTLSKAVRNTAIVALAIFSSSLFNSCSEKTAVVSTAPITNSVAKIKTATDSLTLKSATILSSNLPISSVDLLAGKTGINVGQVTVKEVDSNNDGISDALAVTYNSTGGYNLDQVHVWVGTDATNAPKSPNGGLQPGQFMVVISTIAPNTTVYTANVPFALFGYTLCATTTYQVVAHAHLSSLSDPTGVTAWGGSTLIYPNDANVWAKYFNVNLKNDPPVISGSIPESTVEGCGAADAGAPVTSVADLEKMGVTITDLRTPDASLVVTSSDVAAGSCPVVVTRTYTITDECGASSSVTQKINVADTKAPTITGTIAESTVEGCSAANAPAPVTTVDALKALGLTITDNCTLASNVTSSDAATGSCPIVVTRTYTVSDACGNKSTAVQVIKIKDTIAPTASNPAAINASCDNIPAPNTAVVTDARDNCGGPVSVSFVGDVVNGSGCSYTITRTYKVADACGNSTLVMQTINVSDTTPPVLSGQGADATIACGATPVFTAPIATDNCSTATVTQLGSDLVETGTGYVWTTRTWVATDACGNVSAPVSQKIINDCSNIQPSVSGFAAAGTGWAYNSTLSRTFSSIANKNSNNWGWTNGLLTQNAAPYKFSLIVGAGQNDLSKGAPVGEVSVTYTASGVVVTLNVVSSVKITGAQVYVGKDVLPLSKQGVYQSAPGQLGNNSGTLSGVNTYTFTISKLADGTRISSSTGSVYVAVHADIALK